MPTEHIHTSLLFYFSKKYATPGHITMSRKSMHYIIVNINKSIFDMDSLPTNIQIKKQQNNNNNINLPTKIKIKNKNQN